MANSTNTNEAQLVERLRQGDPVAREQFFKTYFDRLYSLVFNQEVGTRRLPKILCRRLSSAP